ncbi:YdbL family protein [Photobacterium leiognathi]|uniref:YdbL family protein n=1 Tax=Photobacterium leiognathi TaxID=553611 RepID=UPI0029811EED|nr:YdbL family protein [Photobacterium leiognathi]
MFSKFHRSVIKTALIISVLCSANTAMALTLQQAKQQGLIGEANTGYVASVQSAPTAKVKQLVDDTNQKRKLGYQQISQQNNMSIEEVTALGRAKAKQKTLPGHYFQTKNGEWIKK